jgi:hypothetical protein
MSRTIRLGSVLVPLPPNLTFLPVKWMDALQTLLELRIIIGVTRSVRCTRNPRQLSFLGRCSGSASSAVDFTLWSNLMKADAAAEDVWQGITSAVEKLSPTHRQLEWRTSRA